MNSRTVEQASGGDRILLFTNRIEHAPAGGRELLCKLNHDILRDIFGERLILCEIPKTKLRGWKSILLAFSGHIDGLTDTHIKHALQLVRTQNVSRIFVDGSGFGGLVKIAKRTFPQVAISTFFHNAEAKFFWGSLRNARTVRALAVLCVNYLAERKSVRYSDAIICLSERDSRTLRALYGRGATHISPMAMRDTASDSDRDSVRDPAERYALFVGGGFYANRAGIQWYAEQVAPRINIKTCIVGRGLDDLESRLQHHDNVVLVGAVDSVAHWYRNALFVVAPVFDGSGMKTKVAEALMFGKKIIGTPEAFSGYQDVVEHAGWECTSADEFIAAINIAQDRIVDAFDPTLRAIYDNRYSYQAARSRLADILNASP